MFFVGVFGLGVPLSLELPEGLFDLTPEILFPEDVVPFGAVVFLLDPELPFGVLEGVGVWLLLLVLPFDGVPPELLLGAFQLFPPLFIPGFEPGV